MIQYVVQLYKLVTKLLIENFDTVRVVVLVALLALLLIAALVERSINRYDSMLLFWLLIILAALAGLRLLIVASRM